MINAVCNKIDQHQFFMRQKNLVFVFMSVKEFWKMNLFKKDFPEKIFLENKKNVFLKKNLMKKNSYEKRSL